MRPLSNFDINLNFWEANPQLIILKEFQTIYGSDKGGARSSQIMWAVAFVVDVDSDYFGMEDQEKMKLIAEDWLEEPNFKWEDYKDVISAYIYVVDGPIRRSIRDWGEKLDERRDFINGLKYSLTNAALIDKLMISTKIIYEEYQKATDTYLHQGDADAGNTKGDLVESLTEKKII